MMYYVDNEWPWLKRRSDPAPLSKEYVSRSRGLVSNFDVKYRRPQVGTGKILLKGVNAECRIVCARRHSR